jgi:transcriptional regulator with XRE-family HTH domain
MYILMIQVRDIRTKVFEVSQIEMAEIAGVRQPTISRWETAKSRVPATALSRIRDAAKARRLPWDDRWVFGHKVHAAKLHAASSPSSQKRSRNLNRVRS